jgi:acyl transferase domain-containing protein
MERALSEQSEKYSSTQTKMEQIALVGISCAFAGNVDSPHSFWQLLKNSIDSGSEISSERMDLESFIGSLQNLHPILKDKPIHRGYFLRNELLDQFDAQFFDLTESEARTIDPAHRLLMQKFVHLCEDANIPLDRMRETKTAVFIGQYSSEHQRTVSVQPLETRTAALGTNVHKYNASARLAYHFDLRGSNANLDTACSSSLQAVQLAVHSLRLGEADMAVAGGVNLVYSPDGLVNDSFVQAISPDGRSRSYSSDANGYAKGECVYVLETNYYSFLLGEGTALILLKRLSDAVRDGNQIYCVIRDILSNHDGHWSDKPGYTVPSSEGQLALLQEIYNQRNQIDLAQVYYIEGHGTGTQVGDPIEANMLGKFFGRTSADQPLLLGSVKSHRGHTEGTAGVAGLIKVALAMKHRQIPAQMHFKQMNLKIKSKKFNLHIVQNLTRFPSPSRPVIIGINSFGMGGNNCHAIIEEYLQRRPEITTNGFHDKTLKQSYLAVFSGEN